MKILSLFDGISCGRVALERAGIKVDWGHFGNGFAWDKPLSI